MMRRRVAIVAVAPAVSVLMLGVLAAREAITVADRYGFPRAPDVSPYRTLLWWLFAAAVSLVLTVTAIVFVAFRPRLRNAFVKAVGVVLLLVGFLASPFLIDAFVVSTRSRVDFECLLPGPVLLWAPAVLAGIATLVFRRYRRLPLNAPPQTRGVA
jgi:hypothetical protein